jgi:hypothetical protein
MLAGLKQAQRILRWAEGHDDLEEERAAADASQAEEGPARLEAADAAARVADDPAAAAEPAPQPVAKSD